MILSTSNEDRLTDRFDLGKGNEMKKIIAQEIANVPRKKKNSIM